MRRIDRRHFLGMVGAGAALSLPPVLRDLSGASHPQTGRNRLGVPPTVSPDGLTLTARATPVDIGPGSVEAFTLNGVAPAPTIRARTGDRFRAELVNGLPEPTILHWHGLAVPEEADGHPRLQIDPGERYAYDFEVVNGPGTYWYHAHTHELTAPQAYKGLAGLLIVDGDESEEFGLPGAEHEIAVVLQDKRLGASLELRYQPGMGPDMMMGYLGDTAFGNGVMNPTVNVERRPYRMRLLNGSNARIFDVGLSNGAEMTLIGGDGGLLEAPVRLPRVMMATGERVEVIIDFSRARTAERIMLRSLDFEAPGMMGMMRMMMGRGGRGGRGGMGMMGGGGLPQGVEMDLLEFVVQDGPADPGPPLPTRFAPVPDRGRITDDTPRRTFRFQSQMMSHTINGLTFDMERIDERVPLRRTEVWTFVNESEVAHPVHAHAGLFRVLSRTGGRGEVMPWETGLKDTVLVMPSEIVDVAVRFAFPGLYLLHCHNLEHEDMGMMLNFEVVESRIHNPTGGRP